MLNAAAIADLRRKRRGLCSSSEPLGYQLFLMVGPPPVSMWPSLEL